MYRRSTPTYRRTWSYHSQRGHGLPQPPLDTPLLNVHEILFLKLSLMLNGFRRKYLFLFFTLGNARRRFYSPKMDISNDDEILECCVGSGERRAWKAKKVREPPKTYVRKKLRELPKRTRDISARILSKGLRKTWFPYNRYDRWGRCDHWRKCLRRSQLSCGNREFSDCLDLRAHGFHTIQLPSPMTFFPVIAAISMIVTIVSIIGYSKARGSSVDSFDKTAAF